MRRPLGVTPIHLALTNRSDEVLVLCVGVAELELERHTVEMYASAVFCTHMTLTFDL